MAESVFTEPRTQTTTGPASGESPDRATDLRSALDDVEREMIVKALQATRGNKAKAARALGITERIMGLRVKKYGIDPRVFRGRPYGPNRTNGGARDED